MRAQPVVRHIISAEFSAGVNYPEYSSRRSRGRPYFSRWDKLKSRDCFLARERTVKERAGGETGGTGFLRPAFSQTREVTELGRTNRGAPRALAREGTRRGSFIPALTLSARVFPGSCDVRGEAMQLQLHPTYFRVSHPAIFRLRVRGRNSLLPSLPLRLSLFFSSLRGSTTQSYVIGGECAPRLASRGGIVGREMRSSSRRRDFVIQTIVARQRHGRYHPRDYFPSAETATVRNVARGTARFT